VRLPRVHGSPSKVATANCTPLPHRLHAARNGRVILG
jgi:hypothetical protein